jgi:DNA/RNA endonuclease YhcR with UshA esterase domain
MKQFFIITSFVSLFFFKAAAQIVIPGKDADKHIGETVVLTDMVFGSEQIKSSNKVLLYLGDNYPNQTLTAVINATDENKFKEQAENYYKGRNFKVTGKLVQYKGKPAIVISNPDQLKEVLTDNNIQSFH